MVSPEFFRQLALNIDGVEELPHFEKTSFRIRNKIFATLDLKHNRACLKLSETDQDLFALAGKASVYPVPNSWGKQGWTFFELRTVRKSHFTKALEASFQHVVSKHK